MGEFNHPFLPGPKGTIIPGNYWTPSLANLNPAKNATHEKANSFQTDSP